MILGRLPYRLASETISANVRATVASMGKGSNSAYTAESVRRRMARTLGLSAIRTPSWSSAIVMTETGLWHPEEDRVDADASWL